MYLHLVTPDTHRSIVVCAGRDLNRLEDVGDAIQIDGRVTGSDGCGAREWPEEEAALGSRPYSVLQGQLTAEL